MTTHKLTPSGYKQLSTRLTTLEEKCKKLGNQIQENALAESLLEDLEHHELVRERLHLQKEITELKYTIANSQIIKSQTYSKAQEGCSVKLVNHRICHIFRIVDKLEANPSEGKISSESPLGNSIVGKKVGDKVTVRTPSGKTYFNIADVA